MAYFNYDRKRYATEDIATCYKCAKKAGIENEMFINFGVLLGIVREDDFISGDNDVDMCVKTDGITKQQQDDYIKCLKEEGMFFAREKMAKRKDNGMALWFTLRKQSGRAKFCHWWGFEWNNFWWWSKGGKWTRPNKFDPNRWPYTSNTDAIALGMPAEYVKKLMWIKFRGVKVQVPEMYGPVLDWEYPGWPLPQGGSSRKQVACIIEDWSNPRTWKVKSTLSPL